MVERWKVQGSGRWIHGLEVTPLIRQRINRGIMETRFISDHGRILSLLTNGDRVRLTLAADEETTGDFLRDPAANEGSIDGFRDLDGGSKSFPAAETLTLENALIAASALVTDGNWPAGAIDTP